VVKQLSSNELRVLDQDAADLQEALHELVRVYQFRDRKRICCHDISVTQCYTLRELARGGASLSRLAATLYLDESTLSRVVDALERKGYAARGKDPADGRGVRIEATDKGRRLYEKIAEDLLEQQRALVSDFDPEVRRAATALIRRLAEEAAARFSRDDGRCCPPSPENPSPGGHS
jgi:DNA-binding MarR family transcriptional regulator